MVIALAAVLAFSLRSLGQERERLLGDFAGAQEATVRKLGSNLDDALQNLEEDARVIATLIQGSPSRSQDPSRDEGQAAMLASFRALAIVVRHYRGLALFGPDGAVRISATDPSEKHVTREALLRMSRTAAAAAPGEGRRLTGPVMGAPDHYFYFYTFPVGAETVVITLDAPRFIQAGLRATPEGRVLVTDPGGVEWTGCVGGSPCRAEPAGPRIPAGSAGASGVSWLDGSAAAALQLPHERAVAAWLTLESAAAGRWRLTLIASAAALHAREHSLARQFLFTTLGMLAAIAIVGAFIVRQQRYSGALAERLKNAETLRSLERQLMRAEKLATTGVLAAGIAHEVGTPLGIIRARAEILMDELRGHDAGPALDTILKQIDGISSTIRQVLDFSRSQPVEMRPVEPAAAIHAATDLLQHRFRAQQLVVHVDVEPDVPEIAADFNQLQQVLVNLLLNACDATAEGGKIWISVRRGDEGQVRWDLRDNGTGIPAEHLLAVFDPFFTTKKRGQGTGLGLPVVASIIRNHGGEISLSSTPGEGTTVSMVWPAAGSEDHGQG